MFILLSKGVLGSHPRGRDVHIHQFSVTFYGQEILVDTDFEMNCGRRYGLVGLNGSGKSTILACIGNREVNNYYRITNNSFRKQMSRKIFICLNKNKILMRLYSDLIKSIELSEFLNIIHFT